MPHHAKIIIYKILTELTCQSSLLQSHLLLIHTLHHSVKATFSRFFSIFFKLAVNDCTQYIYHTTYHERQSVQTRQQAVVKLYKTLIIKTVCTTTRGRVACDGRRQHQESHTTGKRQQLSAVPRTPVCRGQMSAIDYCHHTDHTHCQQGTLSAHVSVDTQAKPN